MRKHVLLSTLLFFAAVIISCFGSSAGPLQNQLVGSWKLVEIRNFAFEPAYPDYTSITTYRMDMTYTIIRDNIIIKEGQYSLQTWEDGLIITYKPSNMVWGIWIREDKMYKRIPNVNGGSTFIYQKLNN